MSAELLLTKLGDWTLDDLMALPDDGRRYEIVDGSLLVSPPPTNYHQTLAVELAALLRAHLPAGYRVLSSGAVELGRHSYRQPDVLVVTEASLRDRSRLAASPAEVLLAVEVMSPGSITEDRVTKPAVYASAGIPHYWRLEPGAADTDLALYVHRLAGGLAGDVYAEPVVFRGDAPVEIAEPVRLRFDLAQLLP